LNKKHFRVILVCFFMFISFTSLAYAHDNPEPLTLPTTTLSIGISFNGSTVEAYSRCAPASPQVATVSIRIEKYINGGWTVVARNAGPTQTSTSCTGVSGVRYRAYATCTVYENGEQVDTAKKYTAIKVFP